jgi:hypothetical protein
MATGMTKDLPGFDRLAGFVTFTAALSARVRRRPGTGTKELSGANRHPPDREHAEEAHHVPRNALLEH